MLDCLLDVLSLVTANAIPVGYGQVVLSICPISREIFPSPYLQSLMIVMDRFLDVLCLVAANTVAVGVG